MWREASIRVVPINLTAHPHNWSFIFYFFYYIVKFIIFVQHSNTNTILPLFCRINNDVEWIFKLCIISWFYVLFIHYSSLLFVNNNTIKIAGLLWIIPPAPESLSLKKNVVLRLILSNWFYFKNMVSLFNYIFKT